MDLMFSAGWFATLAQVAVVDLLLGGDNAILVAMACRDLPVAMRRRAMMLGTVGAVIARLALSALAATLINIPSLRLIGGFVLMLIAINLALPPKHDEAHAAPISAGNHLLGVGLVIIVSDLVMSLDNVVAIAAITRGDFVMLALGLLLSIPALMWGASLMTSLLKRHPWTIEAGAALLGWVAGDFAISDRLYGDWIATQSPALPYALPLAVAVYVILQARILGSAPLRAHRKPVVRVPKAVPVIKLEPAPSAPPVAREAAASRGPERFVPVVFGVLFVVIAVLLTVVIVLGDGQI